MGDLQELCNKTHHNRDKEGLKHTLGNVVSTVAHRSAGTHTHTHTHTHRMYKGSRWFYKYRFKGMKMTSPILMWSIIKLCTHSRAKRHRNYLHVLYLYLYTAKQ